MSKPKAFSLFQLVWHFLKQFSIFYKWFGIFCSLGSGNSGGYRTAHGSVSLTLYVTISCSVIVTRDENAVSLV